MKNKKGFTLIEVLIVIGIIAILAAIVILAINPGRQFAQARNTQRWSDVNAILNAVYQYAVDNNGNIPTTITGVYTDVMTGGWSATASTTYIDLDVLTENEIYLVELPRDPSETEASSTGYQISTTSNDRVKVNAPLSENDVTIEVMR